jgi:lysophospholipid acyltransferase (LPLAT)-like uncharacterized protein
MKSTIAEKASGIRARLLSRTVWLALLFWSASMKVRLVNREAPERLVAEGKNFIYAFFHGDLFPLIHSHRNSGVLIPASESKDGEIMARLLTHYGFTVVRGSSKRKGHRALLALVHGMRRRKNAAIAVDGPRGPRHEVKPGALFLAGASKAPIIPVAVAGKRHWVLERSWDRLKIPAPFTECLVLYGEPLHISGTSPEEIQSGRMKLEADLKRLSREAVLHLDTSPEGTP